MARSFASAVAAAVVGSFSQRVHVARSVISLRRPRLIYRDRRNFRALHRFIHNARRRTTTATWILSWCKNVVEQIRRYALQRSFVFLFVRVFYFIYLGK